MAWLCTNIHLLWHVFMEEEQMCPPCSMDSMQPRQLCKQWKLSAGPPEITSVNQSMSELSKSPQHVKCNVLAVVDVLHM